MNHAILPLVRLFIAIAWIGSLLISNIAKAEKLAIPLAIKNSLERNQIPLEAVSIAVTEIASGKSEKNIAKNVLEWRSS